MSEELHDHGSGPHPADSRRRHLVELIGVFLVVCSVNLFLFAWGYERPSGVIPMELLIADMLISIGYCFLVYVLLSHDKGFDWKLPRSGVEWAKEWGWGFLLFLAFLGLVYVIAVIIGALGIESPPEYVEHVDNRAYLFTLLLFTPIIGLNEELVFRVYAQTRLTQVTRGNRILPVLIGSVVFASVHMYDLEGSLVVLTIGLVLGISYQANGKIPRLVLAHMFWNIMVSVMALSDWYW